MRLVISPGAQRDLRRLGQDTLNRIANAIEGLAGNPRPRGSRSLKNYVPVTWRIRIGDWRVLYQIDDDAGTVTIVGVRHRSRAY